MRRGFTHETVEGQHALKLPPKSGFLRSWRKQTNQPALRLMRLSACGSRYFAKNRRGDSPWAAAFGPAVDGTAKAIIATALGRVGVPSSFARASVPRAPPRNSPQAALHQSLAPSNSGSFAMFAAIRRASSHVSTLA